MFGETHKWQNTLSIWQSSINSLDYVYFGRGVFKCTSSVPLKSFSLVTLLSSGNIFKFHSRVNAEHILQFFTERQDCNGTLWPLGNRGKDLLSTNDFVWKFLQYPFHLSRSISEKKISGIKSKLSSKLDFKKNTKVAKLECLWKFFCALYDRRINMENFIYHLKFERHQFWCQYDDCCIRDIDQYIIWNLVRIFYPFPRLKNI